LNNPKHKTSFLDTISEDETAVVIDPNSLPQTFMGDDLSQEEQDAIDEMAALLAEEQERMEQERLELEAKQNDMLDGLAQFVDKCFSERRSYRTTIESRWLNAENGYLGSLGSNVNDTKNPFKTDGPEEMHPRFNLIRTKVDNTVAALITSQFATGDKNWNIKPSPNAELCAEDMRLAAQKAQEKAQPQAPPQPNAPPPPPAQVTQEMVKAEVQKLSNEKARAMSATIEDQLNGCSYGNNMRDMVMDYVKLGTAIGKGPTNSARMKKSYTLDYTSEGKRVYIPKLGFEPRPGVYRVDPWLFFPDMTTNDPSKIKDTIEVHPYTARQLQDLKANDGFYEDTIDEILKSKPKSWEADISAFGPAGLTSGTERLFKDKYLLLEYHGPISTKKLDLMEISYSCENEEEETVFGEIWVCNGKVIRLEVHALEGQNEVPYAIDNYMKDPGSVFGFGLPDKLQDQQRVTDKAYYLALWNVGLSAAPISIINKALLSPAGVGQGFDVQPGKVFLANEFDSSVDISKAVQFIDIPTQQESMMRFMDYVRGLAEEESNMPAIMAGMQTPQGEESATGIAVRGENATAPLFFQSQQWDDKITKKVIGWMYDWNMQFNPDDFIKGDYEIDVVSTTQYISQQKARLDLQNVLMMSGQDPEMGIQIDRGDAVRALLATMKLPDGMVRTPEAVEAERQRQAANQQPDPNMLKAQADMMNAENKGKELEIRAQEVQLQREELQHRAQMEYATKMENYETREREAQIRLREKEMDVQIEYLKLAQKDEQNRATYVMQAQQLQTKAAMEQAKLGVDAQLKATDQALKQEEMTLRRETGSGV